MATPLGLVDVWSLHFDAYKTGTRGRVKQWKVSRSCLHLSFQAATNKIEEIWRSRGSKPAERLAIFGGDLNTIGNSYRRLLPFFCNDDLRWGSLGYSESEWIQGKARKLAQLS